MNPLIQSKNATILPVLMALTLGCFGLSPTARAVCQEGCLTNQNTVLGDDALVNNTTGSSNTAIGSVALTTNSTGSNNTAIGQNALVSNTTGGLNTAIGVGANESNATGNDNTAIGSEALASNQPGSNNTAIGRGALLLNFTGNNNVALGFSAGAALTTGSDNIDVGNAGLAGESSTIRIGTAGTQTKTFLAGVRGVAITGAMQIGVSASGQLGVKASSARFKDGIKPMDKASEVIFSLQPVTFRYKKALDPDALPQFGLVAEQVAKVDPDLVARDVDGKPYTVRYEEVNAMLLNEFLKEHRKVEALEATVAAQEKDLKSQIAALTAAFKAQAAQLQKVSDQVKTQAPVPRVVANN